MPATIEKFDTTVNAEQLAVLNEKALICIEGVTNVLAKINSKKRKFGDLKLIPSTHEGHQDLITPKFTTTDSQYSGYDFRVGQRVQPAFGVKHNITGTAVRPTSVFVDHEQQIDEDAFWGGQDDIPVEGFPGDIQLPEYHVGKTNLNDYLNKKLEDFHIQLGFVASAVGVEIPAIN